MTYGHASGSVFAPVGLMMVVTVDPHSLGKLMDISELNDAEIELVDGAGWAAQAGRAVGAYLHDLFCPEHS